MFAVKQNGLSLRYVPSNYKTNELCKIAVQQNSYALQYVPFERQNNIK
jgi:hypothetical protein